MGMARQSPRYMYRLDLDLAGTGRLSYNGLNKAPL
eukprot:COSAG05_NODE_1122_length_5802_cov_3.431527_4_plen_35_part_00